MNRKNKVCVAAQRVKDEENRELGVLGFVEKILQPIYYYSSDVKTWREALVHYPDRIASLEKSDLVSLDNFYRSQLPSLIRNRLPAPYLTRSELTTLMQWKLTRGKFRPRLLNFVKSLDEELVKTASEKAFLSLPDLSKAVSELVVLKGIGPATASAVLAAYAPDVAPFMSDEAMEAALGNSKEYTLKQYIAFASKLMTKAKELSSEDEPFTVSDVERALWSSAIGAKLNNNKSRKQRPEIDSKTTCKRKRKKCA